MKKTGLIIVIALLLGCPLNMSVFGDGGILRVRLSGQLAGNHEESALGFSANDDVSNGLSIGAEVLSKVILDLELGGGLEYEFDRGPTAASSALFRFIPIYGVVRVPFDIGPVTPYVVGRIGLGIYSGNYSYSGSSLLDSGLYYALGGGIDYRLGQFSVFAEGTYSANNGSFSLSGVTVNVLYTRLDLSAGVSIAL